MSYFTGGLAILDNPGFQSGDTFNNSQYLSGNLFWDPGNGARFGAEYTWGRRENKDDNSGIANRVSIIVYYDF